MCLPMCTHWHHLANTIELVLHSAHQSPQSKYGKSIGSPVLAQLTAESPYAYNGLFFPPKLPLPMGYLDSNLGPLKSQPKRHLDRFTHVCIDDRRVSLYFTMGRPFPPQNYPFPCADLDPHLIYGSLGPPESSTQTVSRSLQPFLQGSLVWQTDRPNYSVSNNKPHQCT